MRALATAFVEAVDAIAVHDFATALERLVWIHDNPDSHPSSEVIRRAHGFFALGVLAYVYGPARAKLIGLVTAKREQVALGQADDAIQADLRSLEEALRYATE